MLSQFTAKSSIAIEMLHGTVMAVYSGMKIWEPAKCGFVCVCVHGDGTCITIMCGVRQNAVACVATGVQNLCRRPIRLSIEEASMTSPVLQFELYKLFRRIVHHGLCMCV